MFENVDWTSVKNVDLELRREFVVELQKAGGGRTFAYQPDWTELLMHGRSGKEVVQFWRSMSQSLQFDISQLMVDKIGKLELERQIVKITNQLSENAKNTLTENEDVFCYPNFFAERKAFLLTFFWYVEFVRLA
jgi:hypothetical protein